MPPRKVSYVLICFLRIQYLFHRQISTREKNNVSSSIHTYVTIKRETSKKMEYQFGIWHQISSMESQIKSARLHFFSGSGSGFVSRIFAFNASIVCTISLLCSLRFDRVRKASSYFLIPVHLKVCKEQASASEHLNLLFIEKASLARQAHTTYTNAAGSRLPFDSR